MQWVNEKTRDQFWSRAYPNVDVKIYSSEMTVNNKNISFLVFCCQGLTQSKLVNPGRENIGDEFYNHPQTLISRFSRESNSEFWYRGTHPSQIEVIIQNGIEQENEYFATKIADLSKIFEYGNNKNLDFEESGKLITVYKEEDLQYVVDGDWFQVEPVDKSGISPSGVIGIFTSMTQSEYFIQKINSLLIKS